MNWFFHGLRSSSEEKAVSVPATSNVDVEAKMVSVYKVKVT